MNEIEKMEQKKGMNHDIQEFRALLNQYLPEHITMHKVQVGGTNGKGSTIMWMNLMLTKMGYKTGVFTSPHLVDHFERICINDTKISETDWYRIYHQYETLFEEHDFTMFEMDLWMAMAYFIEQHVDIALIEVGLGGRKDATTALSYDIHTITNVGTDHQAYLGDTIEEIAFEKVGIFKPNVVALTTERNPRIQKLFEQYIDWVDEQLDTFTPLGFVQIPKEGNAFTWDDHTFVFNHPEYQFENFSLAIETLNQLGYVTNQEVIQYALDQFAWQGRFTIVRDDPLLIVDGAHNVEGVQALVSSIKEFDGHIYFSALNDKNVEEMVNILSSLSCPITFVAMENERSYTFDDCISEDELFETLKTTQEKCLVCGSLYFVADVLKTLNS